MCIEVQQNDRLARQTVGETEVRSRMTVSKLQQIVALGMKLHRLLKTFISVIHSDNIHT